MGDPRPSPSFRPATGRSARRIAGRRGGALLVAGHLRLPARRLRASPRQHHLDGELRRSARPPLRQRALSAPRASSRPSPRAGSAYAGASRRRGAGHRRVGRRLRHDGGDRALRLLAGRPARRRPRASGVSRSGRAARRGRSRTGGRSPSSSSGSLSTSSSAWPAASSPAFPGRSPGKRISAASSPGLLCFPLLDPVAATDARRKRWRHRREAS